MGKQWKQWQTLFSWSLKSLWMVTTAMKLRHLPPGRKAMTNLDSVLKSRNITLPTKVHIVKATFFFSSHVQMRELPYKEGSLVPKSNLTLSDPVDCSLPGSSVHGISHAGILESVDSSFSRRSSWPRDWTKVSCTAGGFFTNWAVREAQEDWAPKNNASKLWC